MRHYIPETTLTDYIYQEKRVEKDLPALKTTWTHRYNDTKTIYKKPDGGLITAIKYDTDNTMGNRMTITRKQKFKRPINILYYKT